MELVLNGVGGRTVKEAKEIMTHEESLLWAQYISKRGSLNLGRRMDRGFAMLSKWLLTVNGHKATIDDFLPKSEHAKEEAAKAEDVLHLFKAIASRNSQLKTKRVQNGE